MCVYVILSKLYTIFLCSEEIGLVVHETRDVCGIYNVLGLRRKRVVELRTWDKYFWLKVLMCVCAFKCVYVIIYMCVHVHTCVHSYIGTYMYAITCNICVCYTCMVFKL